MCKKITTLIRVSVSATRKQVGRQKIVSDEAED